MNDQMEQVWRSKDGQCTGSKEEVEAYLKSKNPLGKMRFPYHCSPGGYVSHNDGYAEDKEMKALVAFANLGPLIQEIVTAWDGPSEWDRREWRRCTEWTDPTLAKLQTLFLAYEEALKQVPQ